MASTNTQLNVQASEAASKVTPAEIGVLVLSPYSTPVAWSRRESAVANALVSRGFLERDPTAPTFVRCTELGEAVLRHLMKGRV